MRRRACRNSRIRRRPRHRSGSRSSGCRIWTLRGPRTGLGCASTVRCAAAEGDTDAQTNLAQFSRTHFANVTRSYEELGRYAAVLGLVGPSVIVPVLPLPTASMLSLPETSEGAYELQELRVLLQKWFDRVLAEPQLRAHPETRHFFEAHFRYDPEPPGPDAPAGMRSAFSAALAQVKQLSTVFSGEHFDSGASSSRRGAVASLLGRRAQTRPTPAGLVPAQLSTGNITGTADKDESLAQARSEVTRLEKQFADVAAACSRVVTTRRGTCATESRLMRSARSRDRSGCGAFHAACDARGVARDFAPWALTADPACCAHNNGRYGARRRCDGTSRSSALLTMRRL